jgi:hypothetical protein
MGDEDEDRFGLPIEQYSAHQRGLFGIELLVQFRLYLRFLVCRYIFNDTERNRRPLDATEMRDWTVKAKLL